VRWAGTVSSAAGFSRMRLGALLSLCLALQAQAGEILSVEVVSDRDRYSVLLEAWVEAPARRVKGLLTDFERLGVINPAVKEVEVIGPPHAGISRIRTLIELCVWIICADLDQLQDIEDIADDELLATIVPEGGSFKSGWARWRFHPQGERTHVRFHSELQPDFLIPPVVGPWLIRRMLHRQAVVTVAGLERLAVAETHP